MKMGTIRSSVRSGTKRAVGKAENVLASGRQKLTRMEIRPVWDRVKTGFGKTAEAIGHGTEKATETVMATAKRAGVQYRIYEHHRKLQKFLTQLGAAVYEASRGEHRSLNLGKQPIKTLLTKIDDVEKSIVTLERKGKSLKKAA